MKIEHEKTQRRSIETILVFQYKYLNELLLIPTMHKRVSFLRNNNCVGQWHIKLKNNEC